MQMRLSGISHVKKETAASPLVTSLSRTASVDIRRRPSLS